MDRSLKKQVTAKVHYRPNDVLTTTYRPNSNNANDYRSPSPSKLNPVVANAALIKPKAKINSSSMARTNKAASVIATSSLSSSSLTASRNDLRTASPISPVARSAVSSSSKQLRSVRSTMRPQTAQSVPSTPVVSAPPMYATSPAARGRVRTDSILQHATSFSSLQHARSNSATPVRSLHDSNPQPNSQPFSVSPPQTNGGFKIRAKVTSMVKAIDSLSPTASLPVEPRARAPSMSSSLSSGSGLHDHTLHPATASSIPHRYATSRLPHPTSQYHQQRSYPSGSTPSSRRSSINIRDIDPATIPLPPHSPPTSSLSFSSKSSVSQSSPSLVRDSGDDSSGSSAKGLGANLRSRRERTASEDSGREQETDRDVNGVDNIYRTEAKTNRKIADLEITNRSLLAINATLESTKHRQAKEIRELRRKLRESRLILPPRTYRAVKSSLAYDDEEIDEDEDEDGDEGDEAEGKQDDGDETYQRVKLMLERLTESGRRALESKPQDFVEKGKGTKVLSVEEQRTWRGETDDIDAADMSRQEAYGEPKSPTLVAVPDSDLETSEDEVEALTLGGRSGNSSPVSPIRITQYS